MYPKKNAMRDESCHPLPPLYQFLNRRANLFESSIQGIYGGGGSPGSPALPVELACGCAWPRPTASASRLLASPASTWWARAGVQHDHGGRAALPADIYTRITGCSGMTRTVGNSSTCGIRLRYFSMRRKKTKPHQAYRLNFALLH